MGIVTIDGTTRLEKCSKCEEVLVPGELIEKWNRLILKRLSLKRSRLSSLELEFMFAVLPYSQNELAKITGKDRSTLTKYKKGENPVDPLFEDVLHQIVCDYLNGSEETVQRLKERSQFVFKDEKLGKLKSN